MSRVEELVAVRAPVAAVRRAVVEPVRARDWMAPDVHLRLRGAGGALAPGDQFRIELLGGLGFDYIVEAVSDREVAFSFKGPWDGTERWSFVADGAETLVRRIYEVERGSPLAMLAWETVGRPLAGAHLRLELARMRALVERESWPAAEIAPGSVRRVPPATPAATAPSASSTPAETPAPAEPARAPEPPRAGGDQPQEGLPFPVDDG